MHTNTTQQATDNFWYSNTHNIKKEKGKHWMEKKSNLKKVLKI